MEIFRTEDGGVRLDVRTAKGSVWLTRKQLAELFGRAIKTIGKHIANAQREELAGLPVVAKFSTTASDGKTYQMRSMAPRSMNEGCLRSARSCPFWRGQMTNWCEVSQRSALRKRTGRDGLEGVIGAIYQGFSDHELYPTVEEKAANLFYFVVKDHPTFRWQQTLRGRSVRHLPRSQQCADRSRRASARRQQRSRSHYVAGRNE